MTEKTKNTPAARLREGDLNADVWENSHEKGTQHRVTFSKSFRDQEGDWKKSSSFGADDLLSLQHLAGRAHDAIRERQQERRDPAQTRSRSRRDRDQPRER